MKKYVKPDLYYESFELSRHIAACSWEAQEGDGMTCTATLIEGSDLPLPPDTHAFAAGGVCTATGNEFTEYCYTDGSMEFTLFLS